MTTFRYISSSRCLVGSLAITARRSLGSSVIASCRRFDQLPGVGTYRASELGVSSEDTSLVQLVPKTKPPTSD